MIFLLKAAAVILIFCGFCCGGRYLAKTQVKKAEITGDILLMLSVIRTQLCYTCLPLSDLLRILCSTEKLKNLRFLEECRKGVCLGEAFPEAWKNAVEGDAELCSLLSDCKDYLIQLGADMGTTDVEGQLRCCEYYSRIFEKELALREENSKKYSKLYPSLGVMLGISAVIMII